MTSSPQPDLSKLRINRDASPPGLGKAVKRNVILGLVALLLVGGFLIWRPGNAATVETVIATPISAGGGSRGERRSAGGPPKGAIGPPARGPERSGGRRRQWLRGRPDPGLGVSQAAGPNCRAPGQRGIHHQEGRDHR